jgi:hypothetical protein
MHICFGSLHRELATSVFGEALKDRFIMVRQLDIHIFILNDIFLFEKNIEVESQNSCDLEEPKWPQTTLKGTLGKPFFGTFFLPQNHHLGNRLVWKRVFVLAQAPLVFLHHYSLKRDFRSKSRCSKDEACPRLSVLRRPAPIVVFFQKRIFKMHFQKPHF